MVGLDDSSLKENSQLPSLLTTSEGRQTFWNASDELCEVELLQWLYYEDSTINIFIIAIQWRH